MDLLWHRFWHTAVSRLDDKLIQSTSAYSDSACELSAAILVNSRDFLIKQAWLEYRGGPGDMTDVRQELPEIYGVEAYLKSGPQLKKIQPRQNNDLARMLINECVAGIIQAETFIFNERGYATAEDYSRAWEKFYAGTCRYYSNLHRISTTWDKYMGDMRRSKELYDRFTSQQLYRWHDGYVINASLRDCFHQMAVNLELNNNMQVAAAQGKLMQSPDQVCREAGDYMKNLIGHALINLSKKDTARLLGAGMGCVHLIELVQGCAQTCRNFQNDAKMTP